MNELIHKLVSESNLDSYGLGRERYRWEYTVAKFTELTVREVLAKIEAERFEVYQPVQDAVLKHFGIEE